MSVEIGMVRANLYHEHPVNTRIQPLLRELDCNCLESFLYSKGMSHDDPTLLMLQCFERWQVAE